MTTKRIYFCANVWISFINKEAGRYQAVEQIIQFAKKGECEIWTSTISIAEVFKSNAQGAAAVASDETIDALFEQGWVTMVSSDVLIAKDARTLLRAHPALKKPFDAIHLATAIRHNCDVFHTFDGVNLLGLHEKVNRADGVKLAITQPALEIGPLFDDKEKTGTA